MAGSYFQFVYEVKFVDEQQVDKIVPVCLESEMQTSYIDYAMSSSSLVPCRMYAMG